MRVSVRRFARRIREILASLTDLDDRARRTDAGRQALAWWAVRIKGGP